MSCSAEPLADAGTCRDSIKPLQCVVLLALATCGCQSLFDPAVYSPERDPAIARQVSGSANDLILRPPVTTFYNLADAGAKLRLLSQGFEDKSAEISRQQYIFDIPILGLAAAAPISAIAGASARLTLYLGAGAAGALGARTYVNPQARASAYSGAAQSLGCAAGVAESLWSVRELRRPRPDTVLAQLGAAVQAASGEGTSSDDLLPTARKALADLDAALSLLNSAPARLQAFAGETILGAKAKALSGMLNSDAAERQLRSIATSAAPAPGGAARSEDRPQARGEVAEPQAPAESLLRLTNEAAAIGKDVADFWGGMTRCALQSANR